MAGTYGGLGEDVDVDIPRLPPACVLPGEGGWPPGRLWTGPVCNRSIQGLVGNWGSRHPAGRWPGPAAGRGDNHFYRLPVIVEDF